MGSEMCIRDSFLPKHVLMTVLVEKIPCGHPLRFLELGKRSADRVKGNPIRWFPYQNRHQNVFSPREGSACGNAPPVCVGNATARIFPADAFTGGEVVERDPALCVKRGVGFSGFRHVNGDAAH